jgi:hypothetical protein
MPRQISTKEDLELLVEKSEMEGYRHYSEATIPTLEPIEIPFQIPNAIGEYLVRTEYVFDDGIPAFNSNVFITHSCGDEDVVSWEALIWRTT